MLFCGLGNHVDLRGLPGGAEGIRTSDLRSVQAPARLTGSSLPFLRGSQGSDGRHWTANAVGCKRGERLKATGLDVIIVRGDKIVGQRAHIFPSSMAQFTRH